MCWCKMLLLISLLAVPGGADIRAWPTTYLLDHTGVIRHCNLRGDKLDKELANFIREAEALMK